MPTTCSSLRRTSITGALVLALLLGGAAASADVEPAGKLAISSLPPGKGNPLSSGGFPPLLIWPAMFDALTRIGVDGALEPSLATAWTYEGEGRWVFTLRNDVVFSNGTPMTSADVAGTISYLIGADGRRFSAFREVQGVAKAEARGSHAVAVTTTVPDSMLPAKLAGVWILPIRYLTDVGAERFAAAPQGTGPFVMNEWRPAEIVLAAHGAAWRKPKLRSLSIMALPDVTSRVQALISSAVDIAFDVNLEDLGAIESAGGRAIYRSRASVMMWQYITEVDSPLTERRVRQALNYAVNMRRIVDVLLGGKTRVTGQVAAHDAFGHDPDLKPYEHDPERARRLLTDAGYPNGFSIAFQISAPSPSEAAIYQQIARDLADVGVIVDIKSTSPQQHVDGVYNGRWVGKAFNMNYGSLPSLDPLAGLRYHSCLWQKPWICRPDIVELMRKADGEFNSDRRRGVVRDILKQLHDDPPGIYMFENVHFDGLGPRVTDYDAPYGFVDYQTLTLSP